MTVSTKRALERAERRAAERGHRMGPWRHRFYSSESACRVCGLDLTVDFPEGTAWGLVLTAICHRPWWRRLLARWR